MSEWYGWRGDDLTIEVALDSRGAAAELSRLRAEVEKLTGLLAADRAAGIVRVDTNDEALHRRLVAVIESSECAQKPPHDNSDGWGLCAICEADAILAALREADQ